MARLSLIIPTIGRSTLKRALDSACPQMWDGDEVIVVADGPCESARLRAKMYPVQYYELPTRVGDFGCTPCDYGIERAAGDFVFFLGDDDVCTEDAFDAIHDAVDDAPNWPHVFAMLHGSMVLRNTIQCCQVSGQQIVVPKKLAISVKMADVERQQWNISDWVYIKKVVDAAQHQVVYHDELIAILYNQNNGAMR